MTRRASHHPRNGAQAGAVCVVQLHRDVHSGAGVRLPDHGPDDAEPVFFPDGTHVHHLNYGIFLLAAVGGYSVFRRPTGRTAEITALIYGVAMGLTFDEFGMWLHLGGSYWQRASVDAVIVVAALVWIGGLRAQPPSV